MKSHMLFVSLHSQMCVSYDRHMEPKGSLYFPPFVATSRALNATIKQSICNDESRHFKGNVGMEVELAVFNLDFSFFNILKYLIVGISWRNSA